MYTDIKIFQVREFIKRLQVRNSILDEFINFKFNFLGIHIINFHHVRY